MLNKMKKIQFKYHFLGIKSSKLNWIDQTTYIYNSKIRILIKKTYANKCQLSPNFRLKLEFSS